MIYNENTDTYEIDKVWMDYVKQTVDYAYNLDMFVILNVHHEEWVNVERFTSETYADASLSLRIFGRRYRIHSVIMTSDLFSRV